jgi:hypothetical protein
LLLPSPAPPLSPSIKKPGYHLSPPPKSVELLINLNWRIREEKEYRKTYLVTPDKTLTMKPRNRKSIPNSKKKKNQGHDDFFESAAKKRRKSALDEAIESDDSDEDAMNGGDRENGEDENGEIEETADEKRVRVATEHLERIRALAKKIEEEEEDDGEGEDEREGKRDSLVAEILQKDQLEESGRVRRFLSTRYC